MLQKLFERKMLLGGLGFVFLVGLGLWLDFKEHTNAIFSMTSLIGAEDFWGDHDHVERLSLSGRSVLEFCCIKTTDINQKFSGSWILNTKMKCPIKTKELSYLMQFQKKIFGFLFNLHFLNLKTESQSLLSENSNNKVLSPEFFKMKIEDIFCIKNRGTVIFGTVESGSLNKGDSIKICGSSKNIKTKAIAFEVLNGYPEKILSGDYAAIDIGSIKKSSIKIGQIVVKE